MAFYGKRASFAFANNLDFRQIGDIVTVGKGVEYAFGRHTVPGHRLPAGTVDIGESTITFALGDDVRASKFPGSVFYGFAVGYDFANGPDIRSAVVNVRRSDFTADEVELTVDRNYVSFNLKGARYEAGDKLVIDVRFQGAAPPDPPEPPVEDLVVRGTGTADRLTGGPGKDQIFGNGGADRLDGGSGNDLLEGGGGDDRVTGGDGNDVLHGDTGSDRIDGGDGRDELYGGADADILRGGSMNDHLEGGAGHDRLVGGDGGDTLYGATEARDSDQLSGGTGSDNFVLFGHGGLTTILDFEVGRDRIDVDSVPSWDGLDAVAMRGDVHIVNDTGLIAVLKGAHLPADGLDGLF